MTQRDDRGTRPEVERYRLLGNPLDLFVEDNMQEREILHMLDEISMSANPDRETVHSVFSFLHDQLPLRIEDEEDSLYPLMRARCLPEDEIGNTLDRLQTDHGAAAESMMRVVAIMIRLLDDPTCMKPQDRTLLSVFAEHARRYLIVVNAIVIPLARARLNEDDLDEIRMAMLERRGLTKVMEATRDE